MHDSYLFVCKNYEMKKFCGILSQNSIYNIDVIHTAIWEVMNVEDEEILKLYYARSENAIRETDRKYQKLCRKIAFGILADHRDSEEVVADTWMTLWNTIPPKEPNLFKAYVCRVVKNLALKKYEYNHARKRKSEYESSLDELTECICTRENVEEYVLEKELEEAINEFLENLPKEKRIMFIRRYWFMNSVKKIARDFHISEKSASMRLARLREQLREYLRKESYEL